MSHKNLTYSYDFLAFDLVQFSNEGQQNLLYDAATTFIEAAAEKAKTDEGDKEVSKLFRTHYGSVMGFKQLDKLSTSLKKVHDHYLEKKGSAGLYMRTHSVPFDTKLRKKKKYKGKNELTARISVYDRATVAYYDHQSMRGNETAKSLYDEAGAYQGDELCRGTQLRVKLAHPTVINGQLYVRTNFSFDRPRKKCPT